MAKSQWTVVMNKFSIERGHTNVEGQVECDGGMGQFLKLL